MAKPRAVAAVEHSGLIAENDTVIVAVSGGADSVCLLHILYSLREKYNLSLTAFHLNHMIRGAEADRDEQFVRTLCRSLEIELCVRHEDIPALAHKAHQSIELCAREVRYRLLDELAEQSDAKIATAHTLSDNAETVLLHLVRGTGTAGLCGIRAQRGRIIRPLLQCTRDEIETYCREQGLAYVTDSTNLSPDYARNRLRLQVMPTLKSLNPALDQSIMRLSQTMTDVDRYLEDISVEELNKCKTPDGYACDRVLSLREPIRRYALRHLLSDAEASAEFRHYLLLCDAMRTGGSVDLPGGCRAVCAQGTLRFLYGDADRPASSFEIPFADYAGVEYISKEELKHKDSAVLADCIRSDAVTPTTVVRCRREGDRFALSHRGITKPLRRLMNELHIPAEQRDRLVLVADGSTVLWCERIGASAQGMPDGGDAVRVTPL